MTTEATALIWLDLETTGLGKKDDVLEVGAIMTDLALNELGEPFHYVYNLHHVRGVADWDPYVVAMHSSSGLLAEAAVSDGHWSDEGVGNAMTSWLLHLSPEPPAHGKFLLAGAGVSHYDHGIVKDRYPRFANFLHYATLDVSVLERWHSVIVDPIPGQPEGRKLHRALADVQDAIELARFFAQR